MSEDRKVGKLIERAMRGDQLHLLRIRPDDETLLAHLESVRWDLVNGVPLSADDRDFLVTVIEELLIPARKGAPRGPRTRVKPPIARQEALHRAARLVKIEQKEWCSKHSPRRERVPTSVTGKLSEIAVALVNPPAQGVPIEADEVSRIVLQSRPIDVTFEDLVAISPDVLARMKIAASKIRSRK